MDAAKVVRLAPGAMLIDLVTPATVILNLPGVSGAIAEVMICKIKRTDHSLSLCDIYNFNIICSFNRQQQSKKPSQSWIACEVLDSSPSGSII